jgi:glycosyltransferase involved in cell wall biosynthesis
VVGPDEGGHCEELKRQVHANGLSKEWSFEGPIEGEAKWTAFHEADLFILPTHSENFGIAVAEALSAGVPAITTHGAPWQLLEEEGCGWWVPVSVDGISTALRDATRRSQEDLTLMGARGQAIVTQRFAWDRIADDFVECYRWLLGRGEKPGCVAP